jgi:hypothetical protein
MLVQRFAWLNRPNATQLAEAMGISVPQLMHLDLTFARCSRRQMGLEPLRVLLEATPQQWSYATLDATITGAGIDHLIRFCPICLQNGYHTAFFQLRAIQSCPIHRVELLAHCSVCGRAAKTMLDSLNLAKPLTCPGCLIQIVPAEALIHPPSLGALPEIAQIAVWFRWAVELPRAESLYLAADTVGAAMPVIQWKCLAIAGGSLAPAALQLDRFSWERHEIVKANFDDVSGCMDGTQLRETEDETRRNARVYKVYWLSLERELPPGQRPSRGFTPCLDWFFGLSSQVCGQEELALLLLRYTLEGRDVVEWLGRRRAAPMPGKGRACEFPEEPPLIARPRCTPTFCCTAQQRLWIKDRMLFECLRGVFAAALGRADSIIDSNEIWLENLSRVLPNYRPYCVALFNREHKLQFWSLRPRLEPKWNGLDRRFRLRPLPNGELDV